jgi:hypothetical protein
MKEFYALLTVLVICGAFFLSRVFDHQRLLHRILIIALLTIAVFVFALAALL